MSDAIRLLDAVAAPAGSGLFDVAVPAAAPPVPALASPLGAAAEDAQPTQAQLDDAAAALRQTDVELSYHVDPELKRIVVELRDRADGTVLRQIPSEEVLHLARRLKDGLGGLLEARA